MRTLDISVQERASRTAAEWLWPLLPIGAAVFCLSALIYYHVQFEVVQVRSAMQVVVAAIYQAIGFAPAVMFFLLLLTWSSIWFVTGRLERPLMRVSRLAAMAVMLGVFLNLGDGGVAAAVHKGALGAWFAGCLVSAIGYYPSIVLVWAVTFASLLLATDFFFSDSFERLRQRPGAETGVETSVTDHLRGLGAQNLDVLSRGAPPTAAEPIGSVPPTRGGSDAVAAPELDFLRELTVDESAPGAELDVEPDQMSGSRRRRSYFDRRREVAPDAGPAEVADEPAGEHGTAAGDLDVTLAAEWAAAATEHTDSEHADSDVFAAGVAVEPVVEEPADEAASVPALDVDEAASSFVAVAEVDALAEPSVGSADDGVEDRPDADDREPEARVAEDGEPEADEREQEPAADEEPEVELPQPTYVAIETTPEASEAPGEAEAEPVAELAAEPESLVSIPRPERPPSDHALPTAPRTPVRREEASVRQQKLFGTGVDEGLVQEAIELASGQSRVTATLLQRRLRIDYQQAMDVLAQLGARGVVELEADASQGRVVV